MSEYFINCFAYDIKRGTANKCQALNYAYCAKEGHCSFFKTKEQHQADREKFGGPLPERVYADQEDE